jgi:streptomycin 3"-adenylyltransferase
MDTRPPPDVDRYARQVAAVAGRALGEQLVAAYLHGSAVLGGYTPKRSDVDVMLIVDGELQPSILQALAFSLGRDRLRPPACGIELDVLTARTAAHPTRPTPFELVMTSGVDGHRVTLGVDHGPYDDGVLHLAVTREAGHPLVGPEPRKLIGQVPRWSILAQLEDELDWAGAHASTAYQALGAARAWMYAEGDRIGSKIDAADWAQGRGHDDVLCAAVRFQRGETDTTPDADTVRALVADARQAIARAGREPGVGLKRDPLHRRQPSG